MRPKMIELDHVRLDGGTQVRVEIDPATVREYAARYADGLPMPPIRLMFDGQDYWLIDGFHRWHGASAAKLNTIACLWERGTREDAVRAAISGTHNDHGKPYTNADKAKRVRMALTAFADLSNNAIAKKLGISDKTIAKYRAEMESISEIPKCSTRETADGRQYPARRFASLDLDDIPLGPTSPAGEAEPIPDELQAARQQAENDAPEPNADPPPDPSDPGEPRENVYQDAVGQTFPRAYREKLQADFNRQDQINRLAGTLSAVKSTVQAAVDAGDPLFLDLNHNAFIATINNARHQITNCRPHAVCCYCNGRGCRACKNRGWLNKATFDMAPAEMKPVT